MRYLRWHRHQLLDVCKIRLRRLFLAALISSLVMQVGRVCGLAAVLIEQPVHISVELLVRKAFPAFAGTSFERFSDSPFRHASFSRCVMLRCYRPMSIEDPHLDSTFVKRDFAIFTLRIHP